MDWTSWGLALAVGLAAGIAGASFHSRWASLLRAAEACRLWLRQRAPRRRQPAPPPTPPPGPRVSEDTVVLIPDGRPWPLGAALQLLELAWRWQVVHGTNLPLRARQGEGAYVWRPPLPARSTACEPGVEVER